MQSSLARYTVGFTTVGMLLLATISYLRENQAPWSRVITDWPWNWDRHRGGGDFLDALGDSVWVLLIVVLGLTVANLIRAPYEVHKRDQEQISYLSRELAALSPQLSIVADEVASWYRDVSEQGISPWAIIINDCRVTNHSVDRPLNLDFALRAVLQDGPTLHIKERQVGGVLTVRPPLVPQLRSPLHVDPGTTEQGYLTFVTDFPLEVSMAEHPLPLGTVVLEATDLQSGVTCTVSVPGSFSLARQ